MKRWLTLSSISLRSVLIAVALACVASLGAESVTVVAFEYPPLQGRSPVSNQGVDPEIVIAAFEAAGIDAEIAMLPTKRAIAMINSAEAPCMIGLMIYFDEVSRKDLVDYPLLSIEFNVFYLKSRFPDGFEFTTLDDLKPYSIGVLMGGSTDIFGRARGLKVDGAVTLDQVFRNLYAGRTDLCVANDLAGLYQIESLFPGKTDEIAMSSKTPYMTLVASAIFNKRHPRYAYLSAQFRSGLVKIVENGTWEAIVRKYYRDNPIPDRCRAIMRDFVKTQ